MRTAGAGRHDAGPRGQGPQGIAPGARQRAEAVALSLAEVLAAFEAAPPDHPAAVHADFARLYLAIFGNPVSGIVLSLAIVGVLIFLLFRFWFELVRPLRRALQGITAGVRAVHADTLQEATIERVRQVICSYTPLEDSWHAFERTLVRRQSDGRTTFHSAVRPHTYFNLESIVGSGLDLRSYLAFPGYFVGTGLVLTFMGLVAGLFFASQGM